MEFQTMFILAGQQRNSVGRLQPFIISHANTAYHKQLPPQRTVGTIGSVWQESTPSKELRGQHELTRKAKL